MLSVKNADGSGKADVDEEESEKKGSKDHSEKISGLTKLNLET